MPHNCVRTFSVAYLSRSIAQIVRNATAHKNVQTLSAVKALAVDYVATPVNFPTDALNWTEPATGNLVFIAWLDEMRATATDVTS